MSDINKWKKFANAIKLKRTNVATKTTKSGGSTKNAAVPRPSILDNKEITVQPLATEATGKAKKYERTGPQEFVPFLFDEVTIPNIVKACNKHFKTRLKGMSCDVLAGERGPSCSKVSQLPNLKLIHIRFVMKNTAAVESCGENATSAVCYSVDSSTGIMSSSVRVKPPPVARSMSAIGMKRKLDSSQPTPVPKSIQVTAMMKLGKAISATESSHEILDVSAFHIDGMVWSAPVSAHFTIEKEEFAKGGFRFAFKATSKSPHFEGKTYIVKRFLPETIEIINAVNETQEDHARKSVQMHALAKKFAQQVATKVEKDGNGSVFGKPFRYVDVFLGKVQATNEIVTIEEFACGDFQKYVNNDGSLSFNNDIEKQRKAETLVHFSYVKSKEKLLLVDIQGAEYNLTDPEIATVAGSFDEDEHLLFCAGNLSEKAYLNFFKSHKCSVFCNLLGLSPKSIQDSS